MHCTCIIAMETGPSRQGWHVQHPIKGTSPTHITNITPGFFFVLARSLPVGDVDVALARGKAHLRNPNPAQKGEKPAKAASPLCTGPQGGTRKSKKNTPPPPPLPHPLPFPLLPPHSNPRCRTRKGPTLRTRWWTTCNPCPKKTGSTCCRIQRNVMLTLSCSGPGSVQCKNSSWRWPSMTRMSPWPRQHECSALCE